MTRKLLLLLSALLCFPLLAEAQGVRVDNPGGPATRIVSGVLAPLGGATITVCTSAGTGTPCTPLVPTSPVTLCTDATCSTAAPNPFTADGSGNYGFWALPGTYKVSITAPGITGQLLTVTLPCASGSSCLSNPTTAAVVINSPGSLTVSGPGTFANINKVIYVDQQAGATADVQMGNCIAALPASGGICDATGYGSTTQTLSGTVTFSSSKPVWLQCDPSTVFNVSGTTTQPFLAADGTTITGCQVATPASWASSVISLTGSSGTNPNRILHISNIRCKGSDSTVGSSCINFTVGTNFITWANIDDIGVTNLASGIFLKTTSTGWINTNHFGHVTCYNTTTCFNLQAQGSVLAGQISANDFPSYAMEFNQLAGLQLISATSNGTAALNSNDWPNGNIFDIPANQTIITFSGAGSLVSNNYVRGALGLIGTPLVISDNGSNSVIDLDPPSGLVSGPLVTGAVAGGGVSPFKGTNSLHPTCFWAAVNSAGGSWNSIVQAGDTGFVWGTGSCGQPPTAGFVLVPDNGVANTGLRIDQNGNTFIKPQTRTGTITADQGAICTNGELALSAGWQLTGTATSSNVRGNGQTCEWTITTGTTTGANPTVTDTLTNALPNATTVCEMIITGGNRTPAAGDSFDQTTPSATAPVFTFQGTPTAGGKTYQIVRRCGP